MLNLVIYALCGAAAATAATRLKVVEALAARGCADVALDVLRVRSAAGSRPGGAPTEPLGEAQVAMAIRLDCNLVTEAFMEVSLLLCPGILQACPGPL